MVNVKLTIAYDGTAYLGWQKTTMGPSVEEALESSLAVILQEKVALQAASRTDAGVHAVGQVVNFISNKAEISLQKFQLSLNSLLPKDISVLSADFMPVAFHPTLDCKSKEYHYQLCYSTAQLPHERHFAWHYPRALDIASMHEAARLLVGKRDFSTFCNFKKNSTYTDYVRDLHSIDVIDLPDQRLRFEIKGNNFLYKMVRNLVGTLVYVGCGKITLESIPDIVTSKERPQAGVTAPAHGLFLYKVYY